MIPCGRASVFPKNVIIKKIHEFTDAARLLALGKKNRLGRPERTTGSCLSNGDARQPRTARALGTAGSSVPSASSGIQAQGVFRLLQPELFLQQPDLFIFQLPS